MSYEWLVDRANKLGPPVGDKILTALNNPNNRVQGIVLRTPKESGSAVMVETSPMPEMQDIEDLDQPDTGLIELFRNPQTTPEATDSLKLDAKAPAQWP